MLSVQIFFKMWITLFIKQTSIKPLQIY